jgi:ADP-dependent NAD(P)H-hydrate dehydratase / NAD(P)H-hydrate epimerase
VNELLTTAEMAEADRRTSERGVPGSELMENAGRAVADVAAAMARRGPRIIVVAGLGNNGGDGFVAARLLAERGFNVRVALAGELGRLRGDARLAAERWTGATVAASPDGLGDADLVIDALFGAGLDRAVEGTPRAMIEAINGCGAPVLAVDLPSGIKGNTGAIMGAAVQATRTVTFFRRKPGHLLLPGRSHCGDTSVADIGIRADVLERIKPATYANVPAIWQGAFPVPRAEGHKYSRGHAVVVSGGLSTTGAARLAARAALRAGAGLVTLASPREALAVNAASSLAVMVRPVDGASELGEFLTDKRRNAVVLGPGGGVGQAMRQQVKAVLATAAAAVLDADALTSFAEQPDDLFDAIKKRSTANIVLTPHIGEFFRLFNSLSDKYNLNSKLEVAGEAARLSGAVVVLKGADTVVASPLGIATIANNAPPYLATAGAGDVLAGMIGGLLAQGMPAFEAASAAVWLHGEAATVFGPGLIAEDLSEALPAVYRRLLGGVE